MRVLLLTHAFNGLAQRLFLELRARGHELSVEFDINDATTAEAVELFAPDLVLAPYLKRAIAEAVWRAVPCFIVHPGPPGDRGPSALDWAILGEAPRWGVTVLQATGELDGGPVWASAGFAMREARKSSLYRNEVTEAAIVAVIEALDRFQRGLGPVTAAAPDGRGWRPLMRQADRRIDWAADSAATVLRKIRSADGFPGVEDEVLGLRCRLFDAWPEPRLGGRPGDVIARRFDAICRSTRDGAVWIGQLQPVVDGAAAFKRPAALALGPLAEHLPRSEPTPEAATAARGYPDIRYVEEDGVGFLHFEFCNGAMSTAQCERLRAAYRAARARPTRVIVLMGGEDFWSNGLHLHCIEAAASPADASMRNIEAMDDLALEVLRTDCHLVLAALQGNAGAGGVFLALAADTVLARRGVVLNPHYRNMGNLYGSEYWTYLLPGRLPGRADTLMRERLPLAADDALALGLVDAVAGPSRAAFLEQVRATARALAQPQAWAEHLAAKRARRAADEAAKPLAQYRAEELERMRLNFYGFDPSYHVARHRFVHRTPQAWTPLYLARHRALAPPAARLRA
jgi:putative two-component system hydrogenase maturation factor HypX/HoxX